MYQLAKNYGNGTLLLKQIATVEELSLKYLEHIVPPLKQAGLITSARGPRGGYELASEPDLITLRDILSALEGDLAPVECVSTPDICKRNSACKSRTVWMRLEQTISATLEAISLADMVAMEVEDGCENCGVEPA